MISIRLEQYLKIVIFMNINNKKIFEANIKIIRSLPFYKRKAYEKKAFEQFKIFLKKIPQNEKIAFWLNSIDEIDVTPWISYALNLGYIVYLIRFEKNKKVCFIEIKDINFEKEWFKNRLQPKKTENKIEAISVNSFFVPLPIFNLKKEFCEDELYLINNLISAVKYKSIVGFAYSLQCFHKIDFKEKTFSVDYLITNAYTI